MFAKTGRLKIIFCDDAGHNVRQNDSMGTNARFGCVHKLINDVSGPIHVFGRDVDVMIEAKMKEESLLRFTTCLTRI